MNLDLRFPIGLMFSVFGLMLTLYGAFSKPEIYAHLPEKININLWWGLVMLVFGLGMLGFGWRGQRRLAASKEKK
jgi:hypothetical protein